MEALLKYILTSIVDNPDQVQVSQTTDETGQIILNTTVASEDMGKVIGKGGKVINSIRQVVRILALKQGKRLNINLTEPETSPDSTASDSDSQ